MTVLSAVWSADAATFRIARLRCRVGTGSTGLWSTCRIGARSTRFTCWRCARRLGRRRVARTRLGTRASTAVGLPPVWPLLRAARRTPYGPLSPSSAGEIALVGLRLVEEVSNSSRIDKSRTGNTRTGSPKIALRRPVELMRPCPRARVLNARCPCYHDVQSHV